MYEAEDAARRRNCHNYRLPKPFAYVHAGRIVFTYSWEGYSVTYVKYPRLPWPLDVLALDPPSGYPSIQVNIINAPKPYPHANARFSLYAVGPAVNGFVDIGHYLSNSTSFSINLGSYSPYIDELDRYLGMTPDIAGPSVILFISSTGYYGGFPSISTGLLTYGIAHEIFKFVRGMG